MIVELELLLYNLGTLLWSTLIGSRASIRLKIGGRRGGYVIVKQYEDWPVYRVKCPPSNNPRNGEIRTLPLDSIGVWKQLRVLQI